MTNENIYPRNCYTYLIGWSHLNMWYYGSKYGADANPSTFWLNYWTSSKYVTNYRKEHGEPDIRQIRKIFGEDHHKCRNHEFRLLRRLRLDKNIRFLNKSIGGSTFSAAGKAVAMCSKTETILGLIDIDDSRWLTGEIYRPNRGKANAMCSKTGSELGLIDIDDSRWLTGEIYSPNRDKANAVNSITGSYIGVIKLSDPRWASGEIISQFSGKSNDKSPAKITATGECIGKIHKMDPRWETGEIVGLAKGRKWTEEQRQKNHKTKTGKKHSPERLARRTGKKRGPYKKLIMTDQPT